MSAHGSATSPRQGESRTRVSGISLLRDHQACVPLTRILGDGDLLVLLSPVVVPFQLTEGDNKDPFEPFGRALAKRHPWTRHVPYTSANGITGYHVTFIERAKAVIFLISGAPTVGQSSQVELADVARMIGEHRPQVIVACQDVRDLGLMDSGFPTILQLPEYAPNHLEEAAAILFGEASPNQPDCLNIQELIMAPKLWEVEALPEYLATFDISPVLDLWNDCLPDKFHMNRFSLQRLLDRDGFGRHYVVRLPGTGEIVGFCATFTTWAFSDPEYLVGSLSMLMVRQAYRRRGIGRSLHDHAVEQMTRTRGVRRLLLGSTFPRLLSGIPRGLISHEWFSRRGWSIDSHAAGRGREISDWLLKIHDWPGGSFAAASEGFTFRQCTIDEFPTVLQFVRSEAARNETMGLYEEYKWSKDFANDIVLGIHGKTIVAAALLYLPHSGTTAENDLPWAGMIGPDVGGITCICIEEGNPALLNSRDSVMIRLLGTCVQILKDYGMQQVFLDGVKGGDDGFQDLGKSRFLHF